MSAVDPTTFVVPETVVREAVALVERYRLMRLLEDERGVRRDLRGDAPDPALVEHMVCQLVPGVDAPLASRAIDWPIRAGVRLEALCFSPWLVGVVGPRGLYALPDTATDFAVLFERRTGIAPDADAMDRNYRVTPDQLAAIAEEVRGSAEAPSPAYLLLCSRHFDAAVEAAPMLGEVRRGMRFERPLIDGFRLLAELEREALLVEDLGRLNLLSVSKIRGWLRGRPSHFKRKLAQSGDLRRLCDYAMIGSDALTVVDAGLEQMDEDERRRHILRAAFPANAPGTRDNPLSSDRPVTFYGLNSRLAGTMQADLGRAFDHGDLHSASGADYERQALLADAIIARADPQLHRQNVQRTEKLAGKEASGTNRQRDSVAYGSLMLPRRDYYGSAPRADIGRWGAGRFADLPFWRAFFDRKLDDVTLGLSQVERRTVVAAFDGLGALFGPVFAQVDAVDPPSRKDALMAICDMATAVSAISTNRCFPRAIIAWLSTYEVENPRKAPVKTHGTRWLSTISHVLTVRTRRGSPPVGDKRKGTPRNKRSDAARKKALRIRLQDEKDM